MGNQRNVSGGVQPEGNSNTLPVVITTYRHCQRNYTPFTGKYIMDGCMEFMANGPEGTSQAFYCNACGYHRSFHKKVVEIVAEIVDTVSGDTKSNA